MPRLHQVKHARKSPGKCGKCGKRIKKRQPYQWWKFPRAKRYVRCCTCKPRRSDLTRSQFWGTVYDLQDTIGHLTDQDSLEVFIQEMKDGVEELQGQCQDAYDNMPSSLQDGATGELLQGRIEACQEVIDNLEAIDTDYDLAEPSDNGESNDDALTDFLTEKENEIRDALDFSCE